MSKRLCKHFPIESKLILFIIGNQNESLKNIEQTIGNNASIRYNWINGCVEATVDDEADFIKVEKELMFLRNYFGEDRSTDFLRRISIKEYVGEDEGCFFEGEVACVLVESTVGWSVGAGQRSITVSSVLTDWRSGIL